WVFNAGKLDLTEIKEAQRRQALHQMAGDLGCIYQDWSVHCCICVCVLVHIEAFIDFSEDELIEDGVLNDGIFGHLDNHLFSTEKRAQCPAAIVFPTTGTTRDVVEVPLDIRGYPVLLNSVEQEGIRRARQRYVFTDTWPLVFVDLMQLPSEPQLVPVFLSGHLKSILEHSSHSRECILILYKSDLISAEHKRSIQKIIYKSQHRTHSASTNVLSIVSSSLYSAHHTQKLNFLNCSMSSECMFIILNIFCYYESQ
uniref:Uncharacterized protein n=1 Tax=Cyprinus carpio TaxID=7962 RepID=A0A8C1X935_CYPCA